MTRTSVDTTRRLLPSRRVLAACLVALLVASAGCSGILGGGGSPTATDGANGAGDAGGDTASGGDGSNGGSDATAGEGDDTGNAGGGSGDGTNGAGGTNGTDAGGDGSGGTAAGDDATASGPTRIRLAHMSPDAPALDLYIDNETVLTNVSVGAISEYTAIEPGTHHVTIAAATDPDSIAFEDNTTFESGTQTIKTVGEWSEGAETHIAPYLFADDNTPAGPNTAKVRFIHTSPDAPALDVTTTGGQLLFENVSLTESTGYVELSPGEYTLQIREATAGNDGDVLATTDISVGGGGVYTAFAAGYLTPDDEPVDTGFRVIGSVDTAPGNGTAGARGTNTSATG